MKRKTDILLLVSLVVVLLCGCGSNAVGEAKEPVSEVGTEEAGTEILMEATESESDEEEVSAQTEITEATETETEVPTPEPTEEAEPQAVYTYTDMSATMYAQQTVNVRDLPSTDGNKLCALSTNQEVQVTGQCNETSWYRITYNGNEVFVSNNYLGDSKVEVKQPEQPAQTTQSASEGDNGGNVTVPESSNEELPSNPYTLDTLVEDTGSSVSFYLLTEGGSHPAPYEMVAAAHAYIGEDKHITSVDFIYSYGPFKEGFVWKYTVYYE